MPAVPPPPGLLAGYAPLEGALDEYLGDAEPDADLRRVIDAISQLEPSKLAARQALADQAFRTGGITFSVYADNRGVEKIFPFDLLPRPVSSNDWAHLDAGLCQRVTALELFLDDIYGAQAILADEAIPAGIVLGSPGYLEAVRGMKPPGGVRVHISGIDLIRGADGTWMVLEDNLRCPSGVSYVLENRAILKRALPDAFREVGVAPVEAYPVKLKQALAAVAPAGGDALAVLLTPGSFNSAYFEHSFLARRMGIPLVQGSDLFVDGDMVYVRTTRGPERVDVIYRRIDDDFLDPEAFREDSMLGVAGLMRAYAAGNVALANAPGNGVADDKAVYPFVPDIIRYYLDEEPILAQVPTYVCDRDDDLAYVLDHLDQLVVKACDGAGGYGMLMGPTASASERAEFAHKLKRHPRGYVAQPRVELSTCPVVVDGRIEPRRVDLRPYVVSGPDGPWVLPGGLTRVALVEGSYVVNSSQGGGSKDTWVLGGPR